MQCLGPALLLIYACSCHSYFSLASPNYRPPPQTWPSICWFCSELSRARVQSETAWSTWETVVANFRNRWLAWDNRFSEFRYERGIMTYERWTDSKATRNLWVLIALFHLQTSVRSNGTMCVKRRSNGRWIAVEHGGIIVCINVCVCINSYGSWKLQRPVPCGAGNQFTRARGGDVRTSVHAMMNTSGSGSERWGVGTWICFSALNHAH